MYVISYCNFIEKHYTTILTHSILGKYLRNTYALRLTLTANNTSLVSLKVACTDDGTYTPPIIDLISSLENNHTLTSLKISNGGNVTSPSPNCVLITIISR